MDYLGGFLFFRCRDGGNRKSLRGYFLFFTWGRNDSSEVLFLVHVGIFHFLGR